MSEQVNCTTPHHPLASQSTTVIYYSQVSYMSCVGFGAQASECEHACKADASEGMRCLQFPIGPYGEASPDQGAQQPPWPFEYVLYVSHIALSFLHGAPSGSFLSLSQLRKSLYTTRALATHRMSGCHRSTPLCQHEVHSSAPSDGSAEGSRARVTRRWGSSVVSPMIVVT